MYNQYYTYILSNRNNTTLYIGVTDDIDRRLNEHRFDNTPSFTHKYNCTKLVYYEVYSDINQAIDREKQLKKWSRAKKDELIDSINKERLDMIENEISPLASLGRNDKENGGRNDKENDGRNDKENGGRNDKEDGGRNDN